MRQADAHNYICVENGIRLAVLIDASRLHAKDTTCRDGLDLYMSPSRTPDLGGRGRAWIYATTNDLAMVGSNFTITISARTFVHYIHTTIQMLYYLCHA